MNAMSQKLTITGYSRDEVCACCGKSLVHGIKIDDGRIVGAQCFANVLTAKQEYRGKFYRLTPDVIVRYAKAVEFWTADRRKIAGIHDNMLTFKAATVAS